MNDDSKVKRIYNFVKSRTEQLGANTASTRASLAKLRHGVGKLLGAHPEAWGVILVDLDGDMLSSDGRVSYAEEAIWTALTLYGVHQQGKQNQMSQEGNSFGAAARQLVASDGSNELSIKRRFDAAITSKDLNEFAYHARGMVQLFRAKDVTLDYARFACDLYKLQFSESRNRVCLQWGEDFYRDVRKTNSKEGKINE